MQEIVQASKTISRELVSKHLAFATKLTKRFYIQNKYSGVTFDEFQSAAYLGLCLASRRFESGKGAGFKTFSYRRIRGEMLELLQNRYSRREVSVDDLGLELESEDVMLKKISNEYFRNSKYEITPEQRLSRSELLSYLKFKINKLPEKQRRLLRLRYFEGKNISEISEIFGNINRSWIWKLHDQGIQSLKKLIIYDLKKCKTNLMLHEYYQREGIV